MVIRTINTKIIRKYPTSRRIGMTKRVAHTPQDPHERRGRGKSTSTLGLREQIHQDELALVYHLQCDIKLMNGDLDHDIAILNLVA
jgi:hypothetical protein